MTQMRETHDPNALEVGPTPYSEVRICTLKVSICTLDKYGKFPHLIRATDKPSQLERRVVDTVKMKACIDSLLNDSSFIYKGSINDLNSLQITSSKQRRNQNVNFVLVPKVESIKHTNQQVTEYDGLPSLNRCVKHLLREILSVKRSQSVINPLNNLNSANPNSNLVFSEKRWFTYANKVWETIRKSQLIGEYNRLMT